jgi:hypothetical protein
MISTARAQELAGMWHGGLWSALYTVACGTDQADYGGATEELLLLLKGHKEEVKEGFFYFPLTKGERREINALLRWLEYKNKKST